MLWFDIASCKRRNFNKIMNKENSIELDFFDQQRTTTHHRQQTGTSAAGAATAEEGKEIFNNRFV